jgi:hypothetical protein
LPFQSIITLVAPLGLIDGFGTLWRATKQASCPGNIAPSRADGASMFYDVLAWGFIAFVALLVIGLLWLSWLNRCDEGDAKR